MLKIISPAISLSAIMAAMLLLLSCSGETENGSDKSEGYRSESAEIGHEAAQSIKAPMENALDAVDMENERMREYEKRLSE